jgi:DNA (cytosine-5)-methyltransferase 1
VFDVFRCQAVGRKSWGKNKKFREGQATQVLSDLFFDYLNLVDRLRPRVAIAENVKGMLFGNAKGYTKLVVARFKEIGYRVQLFLLNAADCGVPQRRERVFFVPFGMTCRAGNWS